MRKQIIAAYNNLSLIIFRKKYLIPQKPKRPSSLLQKFYRQLSKQILQTNGQENVKNFIKEQKLMLEKAKRYQTQLYSKAKEYHKNQLIEYRTKLQQYKRKYILPANLYLNNKIYIFFTKQKFREAKQKNEKIDLKIVSQKWRNLTQKQKQQLLLKIQQQKMKTLQMYNQYVENHLIPYPKKRTALSQFFREKRPNFYVSDEQKQSQIKINIGAIALQKISKIFSALPQKEKDIYRQRAKQINIKQLQRFQKFLNKWNISQQQFKNIKKICQKYQKKSKQDDQQASLKSIISQNQKQPQNKSINNIQQKKEQINKKQLQNQVEKSKKE